MTTLLASYIETALWSSVDDDDVPLDRNYDRDGLSNEAVEKMRADCDAFVEANKELLCLSGISDTRCGFCFWLNRNGHGSGFWDEETIEEQFRDALSDAAKAMGSQDLYVGDDGSLYV